MLDRQQTHEALGLLTHDPLKELAEALLLQAGLGLEESTIKTQSMHAITVGILAITPIVALTDRDRQTASTCQQPIVSKLRRYLLAELVQVAE